MDLWGGGWSSRQALGVLGGLHSVDHGKLQKVINRGNDIMDLGGKWVNLTVVWKDKLEEDSLESEGQVEDYR